MVNTNRSGGTVLLFIRPANGVYLPPKVLRLKGKSHVEEIPILPRDMPNVFVEAITIANGKIHTEVKELVVPPEKRVLNVEVKPSGTRFKPGQKALVQVKLTDSTGEPFVGSTVLAVYDKSVEAIAGGSNVEEIRAFFWKWRRSHNPQTQSNLDESSDNELKSNEIGMGDLGEFGPAEMMMMGGMGAGMGGMGRAAPGALYMSDKLAASRTRSAVPAPQWPPPLPR